MNFFTLAASVTILMVASVIICPSNGITQDVLATICSQTQNQENCEHILDSDPRTRLADLPQLSLISLDLSLKQAQKSYNTVLQFQNNSTDPALKIPFRKCVGIHRVIHEELKTAYKLSQKRQCKNITGLGHLTTLAYTCENGFPSNSPTAAITEDMILACQTAVYVNHYISDHRS